MDYAVTGRPLTAEGRVRSQVSSSEIYGGQSGTETGFSVRVLWVSAVRIIPPMFSTHIWILLLSKGQVGEAWETSYKWMFVLLDDTSLVTQCNIYGRHPVCFASKIPYIDVVYKLFLIKIDFFFCLIFNLQKWNPLPLSRVPLLLNFVSSTNTNLPSF
jgi:hypothetical protein